MPEPASDKTFGIKNSRDLLRKLQWDITQIEKIPKSRTTEIAYGAFNAFLTGWHLHEWVWRDMSDEQRKSLQEQWHCDQKLMSVGDFGSVLRKRVFPLDICREVATASKHAEVLRNPNPLVGASVQKGHGVALSRDGGVLLHPNGGLLLVPTAKLIVKHGDDVYDAIEVLRNVREFWLGFVETFKIGES